MSDAEVDAVVRRVFAGLLADGFWDLRPMTLPNGLLFFLAELRAPRAAELRADDD